MSPRSRGFDLRLLDALEAVRGELGLAVHHFFRVFAVRDRGLTSP